jgi:hypothetical protein
MSELNDTAPAEIRKPTNPRFVDITGRKFGIIKVAEFVGIEKHHTLWECICDCGNTRVYRAGYLSRMEDNPNFSCGCRKSEMTAARKTTHGGSKTRLYKVWADIISRCTCPTKGDYKYYGGRGITVDERWRSDFVAFRDWALSHGYTDDLTIERDDVNGNYEPDNCRWIPQPEQMHNKRANVICEAFGEKKDVALWSQDPRCRVGYRTLLHRINKEWDHELALTKPAGKMGAKKK